MLVISPRKEDSSMFDELPALFRTKVHTDSNGCWLWQGGKDGTGYGILWVEGRLVKAHRIAYERLVGPIAPGLEADHLCRVRSCANPLHVEMVTHRENVRRGERPNATHCPQGHPYSKENTYRTTRRNGDSYKRCKTCHADGERERRQARAWAANR